MKPITSGIFCGVALGLSLGAAQIAGRSYNHETLTDHAFAQAQNTPVEGARYVGGHMTVTPGLTNYYNESTLWYVRNDDGKTVLKCDYTGNTPHILGLPLRTAKTIRCQPDA